LELSSDLFNLFHTYLYDKVGVEDYFWSDSVRPINLLPLLLWENLLMSTVVKKISF
jgi:hypothetical protein